MYSEGCTKDSIECILKVVVSVLSGLRAGCINITEGCTEDGIECVLKVVVSVLRGLRAGYINM